MYSWYSSLTLSTPAKNSVANGIISSTNSTPISYSESKCPANSLSVLKLTALISSSLGVFRLVKKLKKLLTSSVLSRDFFSPVS